MNVYTNTQYLFIILLTLSSFIYLIVWVLGSEKNYQTEQQQPKLKSNNQLYNITQIDYIVNGSWICDKPSLLLIVVITSDTKNGYRRNNLRETWVKQLSENQDTRVVFLTGRNNKNNKLKNVIKHESEVRKDLVIFDFEDSYRNLSLKSVLMLRWIQQFCPQAEFALKTDDDMFINTHNLIDYVESLDPINASFYGMVARHSKPIRQTKIKAFLKWVITKKEYSDKHYPDYVTGGSYLFSTENLNDLINACRNIPYMFLEDVFVTGLCGNAANYSHISNHQFVNYNIKFENCTAFSIISVHGFKGKNIKKLWNYYRNENLYNLCTKNSTKE